MLARAKSIKDNVAVIDDPSLLEVQRRMVRILNLTVNFKLNADAYELYDKSESPRPAYIFTNLTQLLIAGGKNTGAE